MKTNRLKIPPWLAQETLGKARNIGSKGVVHGEERNHGCLRFRNLIEQPDYFEEELAMARKIAGLRKPQTARTVPVQTPLPGGGSVTRLDERKPEREPVEASDEVRRAMAENLRNFTARISGK